MAARRTALKLTVFLCVFSATTANAIVNAESREDQSLHTMSRESLIRIIVDHRTEIRNCQAQNSRLLPLQRDRVQPIPSKADDPAKTEELLTSARELLRPSTAHELGEDASAQGIEELLGQCVDTLHKRLQRGNMPSGSFPTGGTRSARANMNAMDWSSAVYDATRKRVAFFTKERAALFNRSALLQHTAVDCPACASWLSPDSGGCQCAGCGQPAFLLQVHCSLLTLCTEALTLTCNAVFRCRSHGSDKGHG